MDLGNGSETLDRAVLCPRLIGSEKYDPMRIKLSMDEVKRALLGSP
jgi:hypothetical protein